MAGAKETPRQQMITLMYLVLTAMLALQVSSSIIDKFLFLNAALENTQSTSKATNEATLKALEKKVELDGKRPEGVKALADANEVSKKTEEILKEIETLKKDLITVAAGGIDPETNKPKNAAEETKVEVMMIGSDGAKGKGYALEQKLNSYVDFLNKTTGAGLPILAEGNKNNKMYKGDPINQNKNFAEANFGQTPVAAALAVLTHKESEVLRYQGEALKALNAKAEPVVIKFDKLQATASSESSVIANGMKYQADMFIFASASNLQVRMTVDGSPISVKDGVGKVEFVGAGGTPEGTKRKWHGEISVPWRGKDTVFKMDKEYTVVRPTFQVSGGAVSLYEGCGNEIKILVPALGASYDPSFSTGAGTIIKGAAKGDVTVIPNQGTGGGKLRLAISSGGQSIGEQEFVVRKVPDAKLTLFLNGNPVNISNGIPRANNLSLKAVADESFAQALPKEANYRIDSWTIQARSAGRPVGSLPVNGENANAAAIMGKVKPGDMLVIEVGRVSRTNFRGQLLPANTAQKAIGVPIN